MRFNSNGTLDNTFGTNGAVVQAFGKTTATDTLRSLALQPDGKIVAVGLINSNRWGNQNPNLGNWGVARFDATGKLDSSFDKDGWLTTPIAGTAGTGKVVAIQLDGRIVVAGDVYAGATGRDAAFVRYLSNGAVDSSFGTNGQVLVDFSPETGLVGS